MTLTVRFTNILLWSTVALFAVACGQGSFSPTSPSSTAGRGATGLTGGAIISGTVAGMSTASTVSAENTTMAVTMPVTVSVVGTNISTTIDGSGRFHLTGVPAGDVQLKFTGPGLDATLTLKGVEAGDRIDIKVRVTESSIRIEAERRERRGRDDDDEDENEDDDARDGDEFKGIVSGLSGTCPDVAFKLNEINVKANSATRYEDGTCARLQNNVRVEVHGQRQADGSIQAARIELED